MCQCFVLPRAVEHSAIAVYMYEFVFLGDRVNSSGLLVLEIQVRLPDFLHEMGIDLDPIDGPDIGREDKSLI